MLGQLGKGAMGSVWLAMDTRLDREVAIKVLGPLWAHSDDAYARFEREAMAAAKLRSPHIVQVLDFGFEQGRPFIVMERVVGEDLRVRLKQSGRLGLKQTAGILLQICQGLRVAHKAGVVHRDIKPANVMLDRSMADEELVKILDFGVAKAPADRQTDSTKAGALLGTPQYMAPEQARGLPDVDQRADLWSVAVIAYQALTGRLPFHGDTVTDTVVKICTEAPIPPTRLRPELPPIVDQFFETAFRVDKERRFQSARQLTQAFFQLLGGESPSFGTSMTMSGIGRVVGPPLPPRRDDDDDDELGDEVTSVHDVRTLVPGSQSAPQASWPSMPFDSYPSQPADFGVSSPSSSGVVPPGAALHAPAVAQPAVAQPAVAQPTVAQPAVAQPTAADSHSGHVPTAHSIAGSSALDAALAAATTEVPAPKRRARDVLAVAAVLGVIAALVVVALRMVGSTTASTDTPDDAAASNVEAATPDPEAADAPSAAAPPRPSASPPAEPSAGDESTGDTEQAPPTEPVPATSDTPSARPSATALPVPRPRRPVPGGPAAPKPAPGGGDIFDRY